MSEPACSIDLASVVTSLYDDAGKLAANLTMDELREEEAFLDAVLGARCNEEIAAGRGYCDAPPDIERLYDRLVLVGYAIIEKEKEPC